MEWRYRHVQMVRRTIGDKRGTGGSVVPATSRRRCCGRPSPICGPCARSCERCASAPLARRRDLVAPGGQVRGGRGATGRGRCRRPRARAARHPVGRLHRQGEHRLPGRGIGLAARAAGRARSAGPSAPAASTCRTRRRRGRRARRRPGAPAARRPRRPWTPCRAPAIPGPAAARRLPEAGRARPTSTGRSPASSTTTGRRRRTPPTPGGSAGSRRAPATGRSGRAARSGRRRCGCAPSVRALTASTDPPMSFQ